MCGLIAIRMPETSTIAAFATPAGSSALAAIRVSGNLVPAIIEQAFRKKKIIPRRANFGNYTTLSGKTADECVWIFFPEPASYTGENVLEIFCHGNPFIFNRILKDLFKRGCVPAKAGEFTQRAFLNGKMDLTQAEAVANVISAQSERSFDAAMRLLSGELRQRILDWNDKIIELIAETETQIDFSDEEVPALPASFFQKKIRDLRLELKKTEESSKYAEKINQGINVVICGAPNAGKSSLLNALVGFDRAIVSDEAGTTRDFISEKILIGKHSVNLVDTAGIRKNTQSNIEKTGVLRAIEWIKKADFIILVVDSASTAPTISHKFLDVVKKEKIIVVFNKTDLPAAFDKKLFLNGFEFIELSLLEKNAVEQLKQRISDILEKNQIVPAEDILVVSARHAECLRRAEIELCEIENAIGGVPIEFISAKLRNVAEDLSEILGKFDNEDVLDKIFSSFCIGK